MVNGESVATRSLAAVLAHVAVAFEDVPAAERDHVVGDSVITREGNDLGHSQAKRDRLQEGLIVGWYLLSPIVPGVLLEVVRVDNACSFGGNQRQ